MATVGPGLAPPVAAGPGQSVEEARADVVSLLSDEAKALVLGELLDMRSVAQRSGGDMLVRWTDSAIRRVARGLYRYELRRIDPATTLPQIDIDTTQW